ncbi:hypothetical protein B6F30_08175, partial [Mycobacterium tuberculosis variant bovis]
TCRNRVVALSWAQRPSPTAKASVADVTKERYGQIFMWRSGIGGSAPASRARPGCEKIWNLPGLLAYWA